MKSLLFFLAFVVILTSCKKEDDSAKITSKKDIASITQTSYNASLVNGVVTKGSYTNKIVDNYNENGWLIDETLYFNNEYSQTDWYVYSGNTFTTTNNTNGKLTSTYATGTVNDDGNRLTCNVFVGILLEYVFIYTYNASGQLTELLTTAVINNNEVYKSTYEYDNDGNPTKIYDYKNGNLSSTLNYEYKKYDERGNWIYQTGKQIYSDNKTHYYITEREIIYWK